MEDEDFLAAVEADNVCAPVEDRQPEPEPAPAVETPPEPEPPVTAEPAPEPVQPIAEPAPKQPEPGFVPITAIIDERLKRQAAEAELALFRERQAQQQQAPAPDPYEDPEGFARFQDARVQQAIMNQTLNTSERFARKEHGADTVEAAKAWAQQRFASDPLYQQQVLGDADPYERVVNDYRRDQLFSKVTDPSEFDAFLQWKAAQSQLQQQAAPAAPPNQAPAIPPRSLASAPSAGGVLTDVAQSDEEIFEETFSRK